MEKIKNKGVFKNLCVLLLKDEAENKRKKRAKQKPKARIFKADLSKQMKARSGIIPYVEMQNTIDEDADEKFRDNNEKRTGKATKKKRCAEHRAVDKANGGKADAARQNHGGVRVSAPYDLKQSVADAAEEHTDHGKFPYAPSAADAECDFVFQDSASFSAIFLASRLRYSIASERPPISSMSPRLTASFPSMIAPTSVASSSVR